jgi:hypothetical protein
VSVACFTISSGYQGLAAKVATHPIYPLLYASSISRDQKTTGCGNIHPEILVQT